LSSNFKLASEKRVVCIFICEIKPKNLLQLKLLKKFGFTTVVFVHSNLNKSIENAAGFATVILLKPSFLSRVTQLLQYFKQTPLISHCEIYGGSRFAFIYLILAKLHRIAILNIERGAIGDYIDKNSQLNKLAKLSMYLLYKFSDFTWFKEYYMKKYLLQFGAKNLFFIPNTVDQTIMNTPTFKEREIDYLWVNRIITMRRIYWVIRVAMREEFKNKKFVICGFMNDAYSLEVREYINANSCSNIEIINYTENVSELYLNSRYFLLPANYVFGNNSLLESMSNGVVPVVSNVEGTSEIVIDGLNGFSFKHEEHDFVSSMMNTLEVVEEKWNIMSNECKNIIGSKYNTDAFENRLGELYEKIIR